MNFSQTYTHITNIRTVTHHTPGARKVRFLITKHENVPNYIRSPFRLLSVACCYQA